MNGLLIPFGLDRTTNAIVEPEDATRGRACNCICPGCQAPLLSRHPKDHRVHFAHDSKHPDAKPEEECPFSSAVAIAMMARELADQLIGKTVTTPELYHSHQFDCCGEIIDFTVATQKQLTIASARKKPMLDNQNFDLEIGLDNAKIFIDLYYKAKPFQNLLNQNIFSEEKVGVLAINCDSFDSGVLAADKKLRFSEAVLNFLLKTGFRAWSFHPRQSSKLASAVSSHSCRPASKNRVEVADSEGGFDSLYDHEQSIKPPLFEPKMYWCKVCEHEWMQKEAGLPLCPQCNKHLYSIEV